MSTTLLEPTPQNIPPPTLRSEFQAVTRYKLTAQNIYALIEKGQFSERDAIELIDGEIYTMPLPGHKHIFYVDYFNRLLSKAFAYNDRAIVRVQSPIAISDNHLLVPDIALLKFHKDLYEKEEAQPKDILLVIEVSHTTLYHDRERKIPIYAQAGIPVVSLISLGKI